MRSGFLYSLLFLFSVSAVAQIKSEDSLLKSIKRNTIYLELAGQGGFYSVGYDRIMHASPKKINSLSLGISYLPYNYNDHKTMAYSAALSLNTVYSRRLELGIGVTNMNIIEDTYTSYHKDNHSSTERSTLFFLTPKIGFRYQRPTGGLFFRASLMAMVNVFKGYYFYNRLYPWAGISVGHSF